LPLSSGAQIGDESRPRDCVELSGLVDRLAHGGEKVGIPRIRTQQAAQCADRIARLPSRQLNRGKIVVCEPGRCLSRCGLLQQRDARDRIATLQQQAGEVVVGFPQRGSGVDEGAQSLFGLGDRAGLEKLLGKYVLAPFDVISMRLGDRRRHVGMFHDPWVRGELLIGEQRVGEQGIRYMAVIDRGEHEIRKPSSIEEARFVDRVARQQPVPTASAAACCAEPAMRRP